MKVIELLERYDVQPPEPKKFDERRQYIVDTEWNIIDSFMSMEAATRAIRNSPKKFVTGEFMIKSGKEMDLHFNPQLNELDH